MHVGCLACHVYLLQSVLTINYIGFEMIHRQDSDHEAASKLYTELKDCLFPKHGGSRKPAIPGPTENLEFFEKAISIVASLKVKECVMCTVEQIRKLPKRSG